MSALILVLPDKVHAAVVLKPAEDRLKCIINTTGATDNAMLNQFPGLLFGSFDLLIVLYGVGSLSKIVMGVQQGEELAQLIRTPSVVVFAILMIILLQKMFLAESGC